MSFKKLVTLEKPPKVAVTGSFMNFYQRNKCTKTQRTGHGRHLIGSCQPPGGREGLAQRGSDKEGDLAQLGWVQPGGVSLEGVVSPERGVQPSGDVSAKSRERPENKHFWWSVLRHDETTR